MYPLISALFPKNINQVNVTISNQMPGSFNINLSSAYRLGGTKHGVRIDIYSNWIVYYPHVLE